MMTLRCVIQRNILNCLPPRYRGPHIEFHVLSKYGKLNMCGMHLACPNESDLSSALETAERDGFDTIHIYF